jgi:GH25 family lysozyme M1 (1,4-beta-N-acetylmuramidase)
MTFKTMQGKVWKFGTLIYQALGQYPMPYMGYYSWKEKMTPAPEWMRRPEYWLPWYANESIVRTPPPYTRWTFWQYTDKGDGKAFGCDSQYVDLNWYNGTEAEMIAKYGGAIQPPAVLTIEQRIERLEKLHNL